MTIRPPVALLPRDVRASLRATCSDVSFDAQLAYEAPAPGTTAQRRIESLVQLPGSAWLISVGGLNLCFDGDRLCGVDLYANFAAAPAEALAPPPDSPPSWLTFPQFNPAEDDRFSVDSVVRASVDRGRGAVRLRLDGNGEGRPHALADGLVAWVDADGCLAGLLARGVAWTNSNPV